MYYYSTPNYSVALNAKVGSSTMARLIIKQFYPKEHKRISYAKFPNGITENQKQWHWMCPGSPSPDKSIVLLVRNPIDRFLTACQQIGVQQIDIDQAIASLIDDELFLRTNNIDMVTQLNNIAKKTDKKLQIRQNRLNKGLPVKEFKRPGHLRDDIHFIHQHTYIQRETYLFKFPDHLKECLNFIGINSPPIQINKAKRDKPILSDKQKSKIEQYYFKDIQLYNNILNASQLITPF
jgi:hypothetical protein